MPGGEVTCVRTATKQQTLKKKNLFFSQQWFLRYAIMTDGAREQGPCSETYSPTRVLLS